MARFSVLAVVAVLAMAGSAAASMTIPLSLNTTADVVTNVCNVDWFYCPRDPGCITYDMSVHDVKIHIDGYTEPVKIEDVKPGHLVHLEITGITTMTSVPTSGSYKVYALDGKNMAFGILDGTLTIGAGGAFVFTPSFVITADAIGANGIVEFGVDVFQQKSGTDEAMCVQLASTEYVASVINKPAPPFDMECRDLGNGHFIADVHKIVPKPIPSPQCGVKKCDIEYYYCPRDPGCVTYTMSASEVTVLVGGDNIAAGDHISMRVNGTTSIREVPTAGSYRIYDVAGKNAAAGVLSDVMQLQTCNAMGCEFSIDVNFVLPEGAFTSQGWMSWTLDVFQEKSGSDEGVCIQVSNPSFIAEEKAHSPPPGFVTFCKDHGYGHFEKDMIPEIIWPVDCVLDA